MQEFTERVVLAMKDFKDETKYRLNLFSQPLRQKAIQDSDVFAGDVLGFLSSGPAELLAPIQPSSEQLNLVTNLTEAAKRNEIGIYKRRKLLFPPQEYPHLISSYGSLNPQERMLFRVWWRIYDKRPVGFDISNRVGELMSFIVNEEQITKEHEHNRSSEGNHSGLIVSSDGAIVTGYDRTDDPAEPSLESSSMRFIGTFEQQSTGQEYWVYGANRRYTPKKIKQAQPEISRQRVPQGYAI